MYTVDIEVDLLSIPAYLGKLSEPSELFAFCYLCHMAVSDTLA
jgi:hypothetical protein